MVRDPDPARDASGGAEATDLLARAEQCHRLAWMIGDERTRAILEQLAREYEARAARELSKSDPGA